MAIPPGVVTRLEPRAIQLLSQGAPDIPDRYHQSTTMT